MQIFRDGNFLKVARITGPTHNFLCAEVLVGSEVINKIECLPLPSGKKAMLDENAVLREVQAGFLDASKRLRLCITAKRVQFLPSDSPPVEIYRSLAEALADHFAQEVPVHRQSSNECEGH